MYNYHMQSGHCPPPQEENYIHMKACTQLSMVHSSDFTLVSGFSLIVLFHRTYHITKLTMNSSVVLLYFHIAVSVVPHLWTLHLGKLTSLVLLSDKSAFLTFRQRSAAAILLSISMSLTVIHISNMSFSNWFI